MFDIQHLPEPRRFNMRAASIVTAIGIVALGIHLVRSADARPSSGGPSFTEGTLGALSSGAHSAPSYKGTLTFSTTGPGDPFGPVIVQDFDLGNGSLTVRFAGVDASRTSAGETAYLTPLGGGYYADVAVVVANARGVPGAPLFTCRQYHYATASTCATPKVSPDGRLVALRSTGGGGTVCKGSYDMYWSDYVILVDRSGHEVSRLEGYGSPEWLPDGRLLMMGTPCRGAGVWIAAAPFRAPARIDDNQVATPGYMPTASPNGRRLAFIWSGQLWEMSLTGKPELTQLTRMPRAVSGAAWSPDGSAIAVLLFDVTMPMRTLMLFRPGDQSSVIERSLPAYPYGPLSWR